MITCHRRYLAPCYLLCLLVPLFSATLSAAPTLQTSPAPALKAAPTTRLDPETTQQVRVKDLSEQTQAAAEELRMLSQQLREHSNNKPDRGRNNEEYNRAQAEWEQRRRELQHRLEDAQQRVARLQEELQQAQSELQRLQDGSPGDGVLPAAGARDQQQRARAMERERENMKTRTPPATGPRLNRAPVLMHRRDANAPKALPRVDGQALARVIRALTPAQRRQLGEVRRLAVRAVTDPSVRSRLDAAWSGLVSDVTRNGLDVDREELLDAALVDAYRGQPPPPKAGDQDEMMSLDLQEALQKRQQYMQTMSNLAKQMHDTMMNIVRNMK